MKINDLDRLLAEGKVEEAADKLTEDLDKKDPTVEKKPEEACPVATNKAVEDKAEEECAEEGTDSKGVEIKEDAVGEIKKDAESKEEEDVELEPVEEKEPKTEEKLADQNLEKDHAEKTDVSSVEEKEPKTEEKLADQNLEKDHAEEAEDVSSVEIKEDAAAEVEKKAASEEEAKVELEPVEEKEPKAEEKLASEELEKDHAEEAEDVAPAEIKEESQISEDNLEVDPEAAKAEEKFDDGVAKPLDPEDSEKEEETAKEVDDILDSGKEDSDLKAKAETKAEEEPTGEDPTDALDNLLEFLKADSENAELDEGIFNRRKKKQEQAVGSSASETVTDGAPEGKGASSGAWATNGMVNYGIGNAVQQGNGATFDAETSRLAVKNGKEAIKSGNAQVNTPTSDSSNKNNTTKVTEEATEEFSIDDIVSMVEEAIDRCNVKGTKINHDTICEEVAALVEAPMELQETERDEDALSREINKYRPDFDDEGHLRKTEEKKEGDSASAKNSKGTEIKESVNYHSIREACMLDEEYFTTDSYSLNTADEKFSKLTEQVALLVARENNDPMYNELLKEAVYVQRLQEAICRKYHSEAEEKACKIAKKSCK